MKFSKNLPGSDFIRSHKFAASYHVPFRPLNGVTCRGQSFFSKFLVTKNVKTLPQNGKEYIQVLYVK